MELPLQITAQNLTLAPADEQAIRDAAAKLDEFASRILSCRVVIEVPKGRGHSGRQYRIHVKLEVRGRRSWSAVDPTRRYLRRSKRPSRPLAEGCRITCGGSGET